MYEGRTQSSLRLIVPVYAKQQDNDICRKNMTSSNSRYWTFDLVKIILRNGFIQSYAIIKFKEGILNCYLFAKLAIELIYWYMFCTYILLSIRMMPSPLVSIGLIIYSWRTRILLCAFVAIISCAFVAIISCKSVFI